MHTRLLLMLLCLGINAAAAEEIPLQEGAPEEYVVQSGDSLWSLAQRFLKDPWKWPDIWRMNQDHLKGEHRIYPGDVIRLTRKEGQPVLSLESGQMSLPTVKVSPGVRGEPIVLDEKSVPSVPAKALQALISKSSVVAPGDMESAPMILGANDPRVLFGKGDVVYSTQGDPTVGRWNIVRKGAPFLDPTNPKRILAFELLQVGEAVTEKTGNPQLVRIISNDQEILERDRLMPAWNNEAVSFIPHAPAGNFQARVVATLGGQGMAGAWMTLVLDKGLHDGVEQGHVIGLYLSGRDVSDPKCLRAEKIAFLSSGDKGNSVDCRKSQGALALPDEKVGLAFVYRVFKGLSYALVMSSSQPVQAGDMVRNP